jgi:outer membrane protein assembly factor BamD (BamD/ComL family)
VLTSEAELIAAAWSALSDHDAELALTLARRDEVEHPTGALAEERAALRIVALAHLDRLPEAKASADAFRQKYPNSVHRELVAAALTGGTQ